MTTITPDTVYVKMRFMSIHVTTANPGNSRVPMNDAYNPQDVGGANPPQPAGFEQWATLFNNYQVVGSKIKAIVTNQSATLGAFCVIFPSIAKAYMTLYSDASQQKYGTQFFLPQKGGAAGVKTITKYMTPRKLVGRNTNDRDYTAQTDASPTSAATFWWHFSSVSTSVPHVANNIMIQWTQTLYVKFWERRQIVDIILP